MTAIKDFIKLDNSLSSIPHVAVVGDVMVDDYYYVTSNRLSPEFPIPIYLSPSEKPTIISPGGAANVAHQLKHFNVHSYLFGFWNKKSKEALRAVRGKLHSVSMIPRKIRLYSGDFPLCRWDIETEFYGTSKKKLIKIYDELLYNFNMSDIKVAILSDYNKGFWNLGKDTSEWMQDKITIVDPKKGPLEKWIGCTVFKPNAIEAEQLSGLTDWKQQSDFFASKLSCRAVLMTNGEHGVRGKVDGKYYEYVAKKQVKAVSVIGAGDCFVATLAACLARDMKIEDAAEVAFSAGAVYVQKRHNKPITPHEILNFEDQDSAKLVDSSFLASRNYSLTFTNGCYDILHEGHLSLLKFAKKCADKLVVAVNSDDSVKKLKGEGRPINNLESRIKMLSMLDFVDYVVVFNEDTPLNIIQHIKPDVLVKGGDYTVDSIVGSDIVKDVRVFPMVRGKSTTDIINKINSYEKIKQEKEIL